MRTLACCFAVLLIASAVQAVPLFVVAGQSNAAGQGLSSEVPRNDRILPEVLYYRFHTDGSTGVRTGEPFPLAGTFGPEVGAVRVLHAELGSDFAVVKVAQSATPLATTNLPDWSPDSPGELYDQLIDQINAARLDLAGLGETAELAGLFWMQGEQDAKSGNRGGGSAVTYPQPATAESYGANLTAFMESLRTDLGAAELPLFVGQINIGDDPTINTRPDSPHNTPFGEWDFTPTIQAAQAGVAAADPHVYLVPTAGFPLHNDYLHFNTEGQLALGAAFAERYLETVVPEPNGWLLLAGLAATSNWPLKRKR